MSSILDCHFPSPATRSRVKVVPVLQEVAMEKLIPTQTLRMRTHALAAVAIATLLFAPVSASAQLTFGPDGITVGPRNNAPRGGWGGQNAFGGGGSGYDCARWRRQCATEGRRCDRVQNFCGGMARGGMGGGGMSVGMPRGGMGDGGMGGGGMGVGMGGGGMGGVSNSQCRQWQFECQTQGRRCGRVRDMC